MPVECLNRQRADASRAGVTVDARPVGFDFAGRAFVYEPDGMSLYACTENARRELVSHAASFSARRPVFPAPMLRPRQVVLTLTHACNLRCAYCFHATGQPGGRGGADGWRVMDEATLRAGIDLVAGEGEFGVGFFGGEPLLAMDTLRAAVAYAREAARREGGRVRFSCTTNGTRLDDDAAAFFADEGFSLIVSLDGAREHHDPARPMADGSGSFDPAMSGLVAVGRYPTLAARTTLRATYRPEAPCLGERLAFLNGVADAFGFANVSVEPAFLAEGCGGPARDSHDPHDPHHAHDTADAACDRLEAEYARAARWCRDRIRRGEQARFHHLTVRARRLFQREAAAAECGAGCGYLTVTPDGAIMACHREGCAIGHVTHGPDPERQRPWRDNRFSARLGCGACPWRHVCGGGCRVNSLARHGDVRIPAADGCRLTDICIRTAAWLLAELTPEERARHFGGN